MKSFLTLLLICSAIPLLITSSHVTSDHPDVASRAAEQEESLREGIRGEIPVATLITLPQLPKTTSPDPASLIVPPEETEKARSLIQRLGDEDYTVRELAHKALAKMGRLARPSLRIAMRSDPNPEVRNRSAQLLPKATAEEAQARLEVFMADADARFEHDIPGVKTFRRLVGTGAKVRALTAAVLQDADNRALFAAIEKGQAEGEVAMIERRRALYRAMQHRKDLNGSTGDGQEPSTEQVAAILVAEIAVSSVEVPFGSESPWLTGGDFLYATPTHHALAGLGPHAEAYKQILAMWIETRRTPAELRYLTNPLIHMLRDFKETFPALCRVVLTSGVAATSKCDAMSALAGFSGKKEVIPALVSALNDRSVVQMVRLPKPDGSYEVLPCSIQDVALAHLLQITNQDIESFGYQYDPIYGTRRFATDRCFVGQAGYAFRSEQTRITALIRFAWWRFKNGSN